MKRTICIWLWMLLFGVGIIQADVLSTAGKEYAGVFCGFAKKQLIFQQWHQDAPEKFAIKEVERLRVDQPVRVTVAYSKNVRQKLPVILHGYRKGEFELESDGKRIMVPDWRISQLEAKIEIRDFMRRRDEALQGDNASTLFQVEEHLQAGQANVVHFHQVGSISSERQGNFLQRLCAANAKKVAYHQVQVAPQPDDPNMKGHNLKSLPQFWFYNSEGKLQERLVERFTETDLEKALNGVIRKKR